MYTSHLNRLIGFVTILAGAAVILFNAVMLPRLVPSNWEYPGYLTLNVLLFFALTALYIRHLEQPGTFLHLGFAISAVSMLLSIGFSFYAVFAFPILRAQFPEAVKAVLSGPMGTAIMASMLLGAIGNLLFYVAFLRARQIPRWVTLVLIVGALASLAMLPYNLPAIISSVGIIAAGVSMFSKGATFVQRSQPSSAD